MKYLDVLEMTKKLAEEMTVEDFEILCDEIKEELSKRDQKSIATAVKYHGELMAIAFLSEKLQIQMTRFSRNTQRFILREAL